MGPTKIASSSFFDTSTLDISDEELENFKEFLISFDSLVIDGGILGAIPEEKMNPPILTKIKDMYNLFSLHHPVIKKLYSKISEMSKHACVNQGINFEDQNYYICGWINILDKEKQSKQDYESVLEQNMMSELGNSNDDFNLHGYMSVSAEGSETYFKLEGKDLFSNQNINKKICLTRAGEQHAIGYWDRDSKRITVGFDVINLFDRTKNKEWSRLDYSQYLVPLV